MTHKEAASLEYEKLNWLRNNPGKFPDAWTGWTKRYWVESDKDFVYIYQGKEIRNGNFYCALYHREKNDCSSLCPYEDDYSCLQRGYTSSLYSHPSFIMEDELEKCFLLIRDEMIKLGLEI